MEREELTFESRGVRCAAWLYRPEDADGDVPCVVMAHGFTATRDMRLPAYAERFAAAGLAALVFDYRGFGDSEGEPRQLVDIRGQHQDWRAAIAFARTRPGVDPARIALWGSSFSGGHVVKVGAEDDQVAAVISQAPYASGIATLAAIDIGTSLKLTLAGLRDQLRALTGRSPFYVPSAGPPGTVAAMTAPDAEPGMSALGGSWRNQVGARVLLRLALYNPYRHARRLRAPLLVLVADDDAVTPAGAAAKGAEAAPRGRLERYPIGHFDIYLGEWWEKAAAVQTDFLTEHLLAGLGTPAAASA